MTVATSPPLTRERLLAACDALAASDPALAGVLQTFGPPPLWARPRGFATLVLMILEQQVSLDSARAVYQRLTIRAGEVTSDRIAALGTRGLRESGFTRQKAGYCHDLACAIEEGTTSLDVIARLDDASAREALLRIRGIGPWTADVYRLFALRRPDVWPHGDIALADAIHRVFGLRTRPDHDRTTRMARRWAPWRSVAARILWHHYLTTRGRS